MVQEEILNCIHVFVYKKCRTKHARYHKLRNLLSMYNVYESMYIINCCLFGEIADVNIPGLKDWQLCCDDCLVMSVCKPVLSFNLLPQIGGNGRILSIRSVHMYVYKVYIVL